MSGAAVPELSEGASAFIRGNSERSERVLDKLRQELGPVLLSALNDPTVTDIWRNADGSVWISKIGLGQVRLQLPMSEATALNLIGTVSGALGIEVSAATPFLEGELPLDGSRFSATIRPVVSAPIIAIRKHATVQRTLESYVAAGSLTPRHLAILKACIAKKDNILVAGGQASGKSTFANAVLREMAATCDPKSERMAILEDTVELVPPPGINHYAMRTNDALGVTMELLVRRSMRYTATRFIVGELRGAEAQAFVEALSTGHPGGLTTIHAGSPRQALRRLEQLIRKAGAPIDRAELASVINIVVMIHRTPSGGRVVREVARVLNGSATDYSIEVL